MIVALIIFAALVLVGGVLYLMHQRDLRRGEAQAPTLPPMADPPIPANAADDDSPCCGMHITCEKDSLMAHVSTEIEYFDDEELDRFKGRDAKDYSDDEIEEFRDVLLMLIPTDIAPWARSIQLRGITLPGPVRDELLMIVTEARKMHSNGNS